MFITKPHIPGAQQTRPLEPAEFLDDLEGRLRSQGESLRARLATIAAAFGDDAGVTGDLDAIEKAVRRLRSERDEAR
ncbi:MAG TPA: hypothetical protein VGQ80_18990, partial [Acidimicrobiia bacterium]|nr:hypothetical protein [Acidimicrobiia bacterium]